MGFRVTVKNRKAVIEGLERFIERAPNAVRRGLGRIAKDVHRNASSRLSGPRGKAGGYPVQRITGWLHRMMDFILPGESKSRGGFTFTAGPMGAVVLDFAEYSGVIHEGTGSSEKFGPRRFIADGARESDMAAIIVEEINKEIRTVR